MSLYKYKINTTMTKPEFDINSSVWVSASAGSGKTTILTNRLLNMILNDVDISKIVCLTYTKTAAREMKERIYNSLSKWVTIQNNELEVELKNISNINITKEQIKKAKTLFAKTIDNIDNLKIFTIHSFCQQILSKFPIEAGITPNFEVIDEYQSKELISEAIDNILSYAKNDSYFYESVNLIIKEKNEDDFYDFINYLVSKRKNFELIGNDINYINNLKKLLNIQFETKEQLVKDFLEYNFDSILDVCDNIPKSKMTKTNIKNIEKIKENIKKIKDNRYKDNIEKLSLIIDDYIKIFLTEKNSKRVNFIYNLNQEQDRCYLFQQNLINTKCYNLTLSSIEIIFKIIDNYKHLKEKKGVLDFNDLIIKTTQLLKNPNHSDWINYKLDSGIEHILIDEAQDTSVLQWEIIQCLTRDFFSGVNNHNNPRSIFAVGDEKQSIYSFQDASPEMFEKMHNFYKEIVEDSRNNFVKIGLKKSFRSLKTILDFVDAVFIGYENSISKLDNKIKHNETREGIGLVELWPLIDVAKTEEKKEWKINFNSDEETKKQELLAKYISDKIEELLESNRAIIDKEGKKRKIKCKDIMILVKNRNKIFLSYLIKDLNRKNITNSGLDKVNMFDEIIIKDIISLLTFILFKDDDLNLANIVKSPILSLTEEDLYKICRYRADNNINLLSSLEKLYPNKYKLLNSIIEKNKTLNIYDLCFYIFIKCDIKKNIVSRYGTDSVEIINKFLDFVYKYENKNNCSLLSFINFVINNTDEIKKDFETSNNQVKIMTIHASKGLQSPIVFIVDANTTADNRKEEIIWCKNNNYMSNEYINIPCYKTSEESEIIKNIKNNNLVNIFNEDLRLFYVALTRAENELYICGLGKKSNKKSWYSISEEAMNHLNCKKSVFEFDNNLEKFVYGKYNYLDNSLSETINNESNKNSDPYIIETILKNIKTYNYTNNKQKIISPSQYYNYIDRDKPAQNNINSIEKGKIIHKLLEILPKIDRSNWKNVMNIYKNNIKNFTQSEISEISKIIFNILDNDNLKQFFSEKSNSEVNIVGEIDGNIVSGRIDRMVELEDKILILDYKNTLKNYKNSEELPKEYIRQLEIYKKLLERTNKNKPIECYILITSYGILIKVEIN